MPAGCCASELHQVGGKSTGQERANSGLVLPWERVRRGDRHRGEELWAGRTRCLCPELGRLSCSPTPWEVFVQDSGS